MPHDLTGLPAARRGHFLLESGHHGDLWLDLELLCLRPEPVRQLASELARRLATHDIEAVCGPLVEGAFVALLVASELGLEFSYAERFARPEPGTLYPVEYRVPGRLREALRGKRVAIVNDVVNAGSAVRGTVADLRACGAEPVVIGTLLVLGAWAPSYATEEELALETLSTLPNNLWEPQQCPLCAAGTPLETPAC